MIRVELIGYEEALGVIDKQLVREAANSALDKVAKSGRTIASEEIRKIYNIKKRDLDPRIVIRSARFGNLIAEINVKGKGIGLAYFGARQFAVNKIISQSKKHGKKETKRRSGSFMGVAVQVTDHTTMLRSAFLAKVKSGHIGVVQRETSKRFPLIEKQVISLASMIQNAKVEPLILDKVNEQWIKVFPQELRFRLLKGSSNGT